MEKSYKQLIIWQKAHEFILLIYELTGKFPKSELFGLTQQLRRSAVSVAANIVEGREKRTKRDFLRYLNIAKGSLSECEYYLELAHSLKFINEKEYQLIEYKRKSLGYFLYRFTKSLRKKEDY